ncbi:MAG: hypothetical protein HFG59_13810 [Lachnospiraceae bacterium]|nr:hypothetical protein [Lachnospiraceae bacterium]
MNKAERVLMLFWQLYNGRKVNKPAFCIEMEVEPRTFDRYIEGIRNFLSECYTGQEILFDRRDRSYFMTGATRKSLTGVEYTAIVTVLKGSMAFGKEETEGLIRSLGAVTEGYNEAARDGAGNREECLDGGMRKKPMLKMQWDLFQCIKRKTVIRFRYEERGEEGWVEAVPKGVRYEDGELKLRAFHIRKGKEEGYCIEGIESFEIIKSMTGQEGF